MKPNISIITLAVENLEKSLAFYRDGLGLDGDITYGEEHTVFTLNNDLTLVLFRRTEFDTLANQAHAPKGFSNFCLSHSAESKEEVDAIFEKAKLAGGTITTPPKQESWGGYSGYFKDLDGHLWEVVYFGG